jgi:putative membrane protein
MICFWWRVALSIREGAEAFLRAQGYVWDTQSHMTLALIGSVTSIFMLSKNYYSDHGNQQHKT